MIWHPLQVSEPLEPLQSQLLSLIGSSPVSSSMSTLHHISDRVTMSWRHFTWNVFSLLMSCRVTAPPPPPPLSSVASQDLTTYQIVMQRHMPMQQVWAHTVSHRHGNTGTDRLYYIHFPSFFSNSLASHAHVIPPSHIVFLHFNT